MSEAAEPEGFSTRAIHAGQPFEPGTGSVIPPVYFTTTFVQDGIGGFRGGYEYARGGNPTRNALEEQLAALEGADFGLSFASGLAAEDAVLRAILRPGDHMIIGNDVYGGSYRLISNIFGDWGVQHTVVDLTDHEATAAAIRPGSTKILWLETPSNPMLTVVDIAALSALAREQGLLTVIDNTFATPALQQPLRLGADIVVHSTTKYLGGHSDVLGGAVLLSDAALEEKIRFQQFAVGAVSGPMDAWLTTRGIKTLQVRMQRHSENAQLVAEFLAAHPAVAAVFYPGLPGHPGHDVARRQMLGFGGIVSVELADAQSARRFAEGMQLFQLAESLGGVESLVSYPHEMTHASVQGTELAVSEGLVRLSVGIEDSADLLADLDGMLRRL